MTAVAGQRDVLASMLLGSTQGMPGCLSYVIATDPADADALWITEVWDSEANHKASLSLSAVQTSVKTAMPLIAKFNEHIRTQPVGGHGLKMPS